MDARTQKLEHQRQILEQKMKQKRLTSGMVQASDARNNSGKSRDSSGTSRRELHGYDGPLQYAMGRDNNPDQIIVMSSIDSLDDNAVEDLTTNNLSSSDLLDIEDDESSPVAPNQNGNLTATGNSLGDPADIANGNEASGPLSPGSLEIEGDMPNDDVASFVLEPAPPRVLFRCRIARDRRGVDRGLFPTYFLQLERPRGRRALLLAARKRKKSATSHYVISADPTDLSRRGSGAVGKLRSNALGTRFQAFSGKSGGSNKNEDESTDAPPKEELAAILYDANVLGFKGPRRMTVLVPALADGQRSGPSDEPLVEAWKSSRTDRLVVLRNKTPVWNDDTQSYVLNFHGRVTQASVKNFQIVHDSDPEYVVMQFGRVADDAFTMDFRYPLCALQAFAIALSSFDGKLAFQNWFGEVAFRDNNTGYIIKNPRYKLKAQVPLQVQFYVRYNPNGPVPKLVGMRLNARQFCPAEDATTQNPQSSGQLFTNKPDGEKDPLIIPPPQGGGGGNYGGSVSFGAPVSQRPFEEDFFQGDYYELLKPQGHKQNVLDGATCGTVVKQPRPLITHGQATHEGEFPWHAALYHSQGIDLTYICGASLISRQHLITVAHCVTKRKSQATVNPDNLVVYLGKFYLRVWKNPGIQDRRVDKIFIHPKYNAQSFGSDIAIVKLSEPAELTNYVRPICLWEGPVELEHVVKKIGTVVGWGFDETGKVTEQLTKATMPIVSQETCIYSFPDFYSRFTSSTTFCAGFQNGTSVCNGDSGGGLILPKSSSEPHNPVWQIRGLVSISVALQNRFRCDSSHYVVFTDVAKYLDFVKKALEQ